MSNPPMIKSQRVFAICLSLSLTLHAFTAALLHRHSLWINTSMNIADSSWLGSMEKREKEEILREALCQNIDQKSSRKAVSPQKEIQPAKSLRGEFSAPEEPTKELLAFIPEQALSSMDLLVSNDLDCLKFALPKLQTFDPFSELPKDLIVPKMEIPQEKRQIARPLPQFYPDTSIPIAAPTALNEAPRLYPITQEEKLIQPERDFADSLFAVKATPTIRLSPLPELPTLNDLKTGSYSEYFDVDLTFYPREEDTIFALTLIPKADLDLPKLKTHYTFLLDRSNTIQKDRLQTTKKALKKAVSELSEEDSFNIITFDSKLEKLSAQSIPVNQKNLEAAEDLLESVQLGSFFSSSNLYNALFLTVPYSVQDNELHIAILLSDADSLSKKSSLYSLLKGWTTVNSGKVALYSLMMRGDANLAAMETICALNRGKLVDATTKRGLKRKLLKLMKSIQCPVGKNISSKAISRDSNAEIELFPKSQTSEHLFLNQPYVILGRTKSLDDEFILFVQGRVRDQWLNIKKKISFIDAKKGGASLKEEWAFKRAFHCYEQYLSDENPNHLAEARQLLEAYDLQPLF